MIEFNTAQLIALITFVIVVWHCLAQFLKFILEPNVVDRPTFNGMTSRSPCAPPLPPMIRPKCSDLVTPLKRVEIALKVVQMDNCNQGLHESTIKAANALIQGSMMIVLEAGDDEIS